MKADFTYFKNITTVVLSYQTNLTGRSFVHWSKTWKSLKFRLVRYCEDIYLSVPLHPIGGSRICTHTFCWWQIFLTPISASAISRLLCFLNVLHVHVPRDNYWKNGEGTIPSKLASTGLCTIAENIFFGEGNAEITDDELRLGI